MGELDGKRILILESDPIVGDLIAAAMHSSGATTITMRSLAELCGWLALPDRGVVDAAVLDSHLHGDSGLEAVGLLRRSMGRLVLAVFTDRDRKEKRAAAEALGVQVFVAKASGIPMLRTRLCAALTATSTGNDWRQRALAIAAGHPLIKDSDRDVLPGLLDGLTTDQISQGTGLSGSQVTHAIRRLGQVAGISTRAGIVGYFARLAHDEREAPEPRTEISLRAG